MRQNMKLQPAAARKSRGSIILLVVGLLTIVAMLGAAFLFVARSDMRQATATADKSIADSLASAIMSRLQRAIADDRCVPGTTSPYGNLGTGSAGWLRYIDTNAKLAAIVANFGTASIGSVDTDGNGTPDAVWVRSGQFNSNGDEFVYAISMADTSGRVNINTALSAAPVIAYPVPYDQTPFSLTHVALDRLMSTTPNYPASFTNIIAQRTQGSTAIDYRAYVAPRLTYPIVGGLQGPDNTKYWSVQPIPFGISDEPYFLCSGVAQPRRFIVNTSGASVSADLSSLRGFLTTWNCSPAIVRQYSSNSPAAVLPTQLLTPPYQFGAPAASILSIWDGRQTWPPNIWTGYSVALGPGTWSYGQRPGLITGNTSTTLNLDPAKPLAGLEANASYRYRILAGPQKIYDSMKNMLDRLNYPGDHVALAAAFTANLWAYQDYFPTALGSAANSRENPWAFTVGSTVYYGTIPNLVITEAYAKFSTDGTKAKWFAAVEVWNPTARNIPANEYKLNGTSIAVPLAAYNPAMPNDPNGRHVFYSWGSSDGSYAEAQALTDNGLNGVTNKTAMPSVKFYPSPQAVKLTRTVGSVNVPVDEVTSGDIGTTADSVVSTDTNWHVAMRDDVPTRARYNIADYAKWETAGNTLGAANADASGNWVRADPPKTPLVSKYPVPIQASLATADTDNLFIKSIGELERIYLACSTIDTRGTPDPSDDVAMPFTKAIKVEDDAPGRGRLDLRGSCAPHTATYSVPVDGWNAGAYPPVPAGGLLPEFFTMIAPDMTRPDNPYRLYGRININTAPEQVLVCLPLMKAYLTPGAPVLLTDAQRLRAAQYIIAYRDGGSIGTHNYGNRGTGARVGNLATWAGRDNVTQPGFLTPGEVAIPLGDYANELMGWTDYSVENTTLTQNKDYLEARDCLYQQVSNLVTVNSDTFSTIIAVGIWDQNRKKVKTQDPNALFNAATNPYTPLWRYAGVIDRSNCITAGDATKPGDVPAMLLFTELK